MKTATLKHKIFIGSTLMLLLASNAPIAYADEDFNTKATNKTWKTECGECHIAYPAGMLPKKSWNAIMEGLDKHFDVDASLDTESASEISQFLNKNASRYKRGMRSVKDKNKAPLRITETRWFVHEHDEVSAKQWQQENIKSPANCGACHTKAEAGDYDEDYIRIPKKGEKRDKQ